MAGVLKEDWRLCADWLVRCQILAPEHKVTSPTAQVFDLAQVLRDGVLICHLLNRLYPGAIDAKEFSQRPQMSQFLCVKNIRMFLTTCKRMFAMKTADLFDNYDLFDVRDFGKVINTLSKLSNSPLAQNSGIKGFMTLEAAAHRNSDYRALEEIAANVPEDEDMYSMFCQDDDDNTKIYEDLCSLRGLPKAHEKEVGDCDDLYDFVGHEDDDEDIYDDLMTVRTRSSVSELAEPKCKRDYCIKELVETEKNYVEALNMIVNHFIRPLVKVLTPAQQQTIFMHIEELFKIHTGFQSDLTRACNPNIASKITIASCFIKWKEKFLIYGEFCSNLPDAQDLVDEVCKKDPSVEQKIMQCQTNANDGKFRLRDLLSVPMQRILKYHLLLRELIRQTDSSNPERINLDQALLEMEDLSLYINEVKRDNEALQLITEIQESILDLQMPRDTELKDYGRLLKDGELKVRPHEEKGRREKPRYLFLFDKVMMICKPRTVDRLFWGESYSYRSALVLSMYTVDESQKTKDRLYQFMLVKKDRSEVYSFYAKTEDVRKKWIEAINLALSNTSPEGARDVSHDFVMHSFDKPTVCDYCKKLLRGVFYQGYQCTITNMKVHKECIIKAKSKTGPKLPQRQQQGFVQPLPPRNPIPHSRPAIGKGKAAYTFQGTTKPDDGRPILKFNTGDVIDLLSTEDPHWWEGRMRGEEGFFPAKYVNPHRDITRKPSYLESDRTPAGPPLTPGIQRPMSCVNVDLSNYPWFLDKLPRNTAATKLEQCMSGTYLIREGNRNITKYAISIKYHTNVKHIRIQVNAENQFYIADCKMFRSLPELVQYYQENSLEISFPGLCTTLLIPYKEAVEKLKATGKMGHEIIGYCTALYDYSANQPSQLSLKEGDRVAIISKAGGDRGWWRGQIDDKNGFFPKSYVEEDSDAMPF